MLINNSHNAEEAIHLGTNATVFQAEVFAVGKAASHHKTVVINCDSQAATLALENTKIKSKTTPDTVLAEINQVLIRWIPAHNDYLGY